MDFAALAGGYDRLRPAGEGWRELADHSLAALGPARRLLDVGCGTGRFAVYASERLGARVWGVDPSAEMLEQARARGARGVGWKQAPAERLPFKDGWFDAAHAHLVLHLVDDLDMAFAEIARVLAAGGRLAIVSFRPEHFDGFHLNTYFPSVAAIDHARFPTPPALATGLARAGFHDVAEEALVQQVLLDPPDVVERVRGRYISTLHLIPADEYERGLAALERDMAGRTEPLAAELHWSILRATRRSGPA
jgi:ubiquinone/menaquinone biosynthesis C-methylase UbiE